MSQNSERDASGSSALSHDVTVALEAVRRGDPRAGENPLKAVYDELRQLAHARMTREPGHGAGMTLEATALVHEAYLRVVGTGEKEPQRWENRGHFFGAAALAMRRILVERARHRKRFKHGGGRD